jgi:flagellar hook-associated protein 3 FlgL
MSRVADYSQFKLGLSYLQNTQARVFQSQTQISSGQIARDYAGIAGDATRLVSLETAQSRIEQYRASNAMVGQRLQAMETNVAATFDVATRFRTLLVSALNANNAAEIALGQEAGNMMQQVGGFLNAQLDGRFLFAGSLSDTKPVDLANLPDQSDPATRYKIPSKDGDALGYYQGDSVILKVRIDQEIEVSYGVTAAEPAFESLFRAMHMVATIKDPIAERGRLEEAMRIANQAISGIPDIRSKVGTAGRALEDIGTQQEQTLLYAKETIDRLKNVDVVSAVTRLNKDQTQLEGSYMSMAQIQRLSLLDFLK